MPRRVRDATEALRVRARRSEMYLPVGMRATELPSWIYNCLFYLFIFFFFLYFLYTAKKKLKYLSQKKIIYICRYKINLRNSAFIMTSKRNNYKKKIYMVFIKKILQFLIIYDLI